MSIWVARLMLSEVAVAEVGMVIVGTDTAEYIVGTEVAVYKAVEIVWAVITAVVVLAVFCLRRMLLWRRNECGSPVYPKSISKVRKACFQGVREACITSEDPSSDGVILSILFDVSYFTIRQDKILGSKV